MSRRRASAPAALVVAGVAALVLLIVVPVVALVVRAPWSEALDLLREPANRTALRLSIVVSVWALVLSVVLGFPMAWVLARSRIPGRRILRALVTLPMVLPPVVGGVALLVAFGRRGLVGQWLDQWFGIRLAYTTTAAVMAATFVSLPFFVIAVEAGLRNADTRYEEVARTLGAKPGVVMRRVTLPSIRSALTAGAALSWARALGEFGATITFAGSFSGRTRTMPLAINAALEEDVRAAILLSLVLLAVSVVVLASLPRPLAGLAVSLDAAVVAAPGPVEVRADLHVDPGEVLAVLGPNGAGKTTLLRALAGLEGLTGGRVTLDDRVLADADSGIDLAPEERSVGLVPQDLLLFDHLDVRGNVAFGARAAGRSSREAGAEADRWLERLGLSDRAASRPGTLSGGEAQRVALARALVPAPRLLLLDEPLAALDVEVRPDVRRLLRDHLRTHHQGPAVLVTHDPLDAAVLADEVAILEDGRITAQGTMGDLVARPRTTWGARLAGMNLFEGEARGGFVEVAGGASIAAAGSALVGRALVSIRPSAVALHRQRPEGSARNVWPLTVVGIEGLGDRLRVDLTGAVPLVAEVTPGAVRDLAIVPGLELWASVKATEVEAYPA